MYYAHIFAFDFPLLAAYHPSSSNTTPVFFEISFDNYSVLLISGIIFSWLFSNQDNPLCNDAELLPNGKFSFLKLQNLLHRHQVSKFSLSLTISFQRRSFRLILHMILMEAPIYSYTICRSGYQRHGSCLVWAEICFSGRDGMYKTPAGYEVGRVNYPAGLMPIQR